MIDPPRIIVGNGVGMMPQGETSFYHQYFQRDMIDVMLPIRGT